MSFGDYARHELGDLHESELGEWLSTGISGDPGGVPGALVDSVLASAMAAARDAPAAEGSFPVVVWTPRHETTPAQSVLSEFLASHGYLVAAGGSWPTRLPYPWELSTPAERQATFDRHLAGLDATIRALSAYPFSDPDRVVLLTWSYAAEAAAVADTRNKSVRMVVGLSSNPLASEGVYNPDGILSRISVADLSANYVVMTESVAPDGSVRGPPPELAELPTWAAHVRFDELGHGNFNAVEGMIPGLFDLGDVQPWSRGGTVARIGYETIARYVVAMLESGLESGVGDPPGAGPWDDESPEGSVHTKWYGR
jgi:hypothetical protein